MTDEGGYDGPAELLGGPAFEVRTTLPGDAD